MQQISRRALLAGAGVLAACGRRKGSGYNGYVFVANRDGRDVAAVDLMSFAVSRRIPLDGAPTAVLGHPARRAAYVLCPDEGLLYEIEAATTMVRRKANLGGPAVSMRLSRDGDVLWVLCRGRNALAGVPLDNFRPAGHIRLPAPADDFDINGETAAVSFRHENRVGFARLRADAIESMASAGGDPSTVRFRKDGKLLLAGNLTARTVTALDVRTGRVVVQLPVPLEPANFCINSDGGQLFVSGAGMDAVAIVYPYNTEVAETILAGKAPESMATSSEPPYLFVSNPQSATVTVLDIDTRKLVAVAGVGADPGQILITPDHQYALVVNRGSGDLAVMRVASLRTGTDGKTRKYTSPPLFNLIPVGSRPVSAAVVPA